MKIVSLTELQELQVSHNPNIKKRVMIAPGELGKLVNFSQAVFPAGEIAQVHRHEDMGEVFFVLSGEGEIRVDGRIFKLLPGVCAMVEPLPQGPADRSRSLDVNGMARIQNGWKAKGG